MGLENRSTCLLHLLKIKWIDDGKLKSENLISIHQFKIDAAVAAQKAHRCKQFIFKFMRTHILTNTTLSHKHKRKGTN